MHLSSLISSFVVLSSSVAAFGGSVDNGNGGGIAKRAPLDDESNAIYTRAKGGQGKPKPIPKGERGLMYTRARGGAKGGQGKPKPISKGKRGLMYTRARGGAKGGQGKPKPIPKGKRGLVYTRAKGAQGKPKPISKVKRGLMYTRAKGGQGKPKPPPKPVPTVKPKGRRGL